MTASMRTRVRLPRSSKIVSATAIQKKGHRPQRLHSLLAWVTLIGIFSPPISISLGDVHFTPGRLVIVLLLIPAIATLLKGGRKGVATDFFAVAFATWMLLSSAFNGGFTLYVAAQALEFFGAYLVGRAFFSVLQTSERSSECSS